MRKFVAVSLKLSGGMSVIIALVTSLMCAYILHLMQTPEAIFSDAYIYLLVTFLGVPVRFTIICSQASFGRWATARLLSGFCYSPLF